MDARQIMREIRADVEVQVLALLHATWEGEPPTEIEMETFIAGSKAGFGATIQILAKRGIIPPYPDE